MKELFISHISDITQLEYSLFGFKHLDYTILKNNMLKNEKTPEELRSEHFITAVSLGEIIYYN